jgi:hypothetical protein
MNVQELYDYKRVTGNTTISTLSCVVGGFLCTTAGNFALQDSAATDIVSSIALVPGQYIPLGICCPNGAAVVLTGGCVGTVYVGNK